MTLDIPTSPSDAAPPVDSDLQPILKSESVASDPTATDGDVHAETAEDVALEPAAESVADVAAEPATDVQAEPATPGPFEAVPAILRPALERRGFDELSAVQRAVLENEAEARDLRISSQTGSGKTVALGFVLAKSLLEERRSEGPEALIIVPTRELAQQVCVELGWLLADVPGVWTASVTGGTPVFKDREMLRRGPRVLVGTPGRLLDHVTNGALDLSGVQALVLDEADQMLDMGFRDELEGILDTTPATRRTHMVSATFPEGMRRLAERYQTNSVVIEGTRHGDANQDISHEGHLVKMQDRYAALVNLLLLADGERTLVFVERRADAVEVAERLEADGFAALPLSGELVQAQRERTLGAFRAGRATVLVATDVAARGLDVPDVATVIHTAPPIDGQVYTHRSGRTGRAGKQGRSVLLAPPNKKRKVGHLLADAGVELRWLPVPSAREVQQQLETRAKAALVSNLDEALGEGPAEQHVATATELLAERDAAQVVAVLLARLEPERKAQARDVQTHAGDSYQRDHGNRHQDRPRHQDRFQQRQRPQQDRYQQNRQRPERFQQQDRPRPDRFQQERPRQERFQGGGQRPGLSQDRPGDRFQAGSRPERFQKGGRPDRYQGGGQRQDRFQKDGPRPDRFGQGRPQHGRDNFRDNRQQGSSFRDRSQGGRDGHARPAHGGARFERDGAGGSVRFFVNWGQNQGANPSRILAAVCRRGEVNGGDIGSIAVHPNATTFDVRAEVAEQFERRAGRRDPRDPQTFIRRDRGPSGPAPRRHN